MFLIIKCRLPQKYLRFQLTPVPMSSKEIQTTRWRTFFMVRSNLERPCNNLTKHAKQIFSHASNHIRRELFKARNCFLIQNASSRCWFFRAEAVMGLRLSLLQEAAHKGNTGYLLLQKYIHLVLWTLRDTWNQSEIQLLLTVPKMRYTCLQLLQR